jgi:hypothetical protein
MNRNKGFKMVKIVNCDNLEIAQVKNIRQALDYVMILTGEQLCDEFTREFIVNRFKRCGDVTVWTVTNKAYHLVK